MKHFSGFINERVTSGLIQTDNSHRHYQLTGLHGTKSIEKKRKITYSIFAAHDDLSKYFEFDLFGFVQRMIDSIWDGKY